MLQPKLVDNNIYSQYSMSLILKSNSSSLLLISLIATNGDILISVINPDLIHVIVNDFSNNAVDYLKGKIVDGLTVKDSLGYTLDNITGSKPINFVNDYKDTIKNIPLWNGSNTIRPIINSNIYSIFNDNTQLIMPIIGSIGMIGIPNFIRSIYDGINYTGNTIYNIYDQINIWLNTPVNIQVNPVNNFPEVPGNTLEEAWDIINSIDPNTFRSSVYDYADIWWARIMIANHAAWSAQTLIDHLQNQINNFNTYITTNNIEVTSGPEGLDILVPHDMPQTIIDQAVDRVNSLDRNILEAQEVALNAIQYFYVQEGALVLHADYVERIERVQRRFARVQALYPHWRVYFWGDFLRGDF